MSQEYEVYWTKRFRVQATSRAEAFRAVDQLFAFQWSPELPYPGSGPRVIREVRPDEATLPAGQVVKSLDVDDDRVSIEPSEVQKLVDVYSLRDGAS